MRSGAVAACLGALWLAAAMVLLLGDGHDGWPVLAWPAWTYLVAVLAASVVCVLLYAADKFCAVRQRRRISEGTLHLWSALGGWPGALIASYLFRHKTRKLAFLAVLWGTALLHAAAVAGYMIWR